METAFFVHSAYLIMVLYFVYVASSSPCFACTSYVHSSATHAYDFGWVIYYARCCLHLLPLNVQRVPLHVHRLQSVNQLHVTQLISAVLTLQQLGISLNSLTLALVFNWTNYMNACNFYVKYHNATHNPYQPVN